MSNLLVEDEAVFTLPVSYQLIETGAKKTKPLIVYLHGYKQNIQLFKKKVSALVTLEAYHLFIQGPYPIYDEQHQRKVKNWGRAWYLYDGDQAQFIDSLEQTSQFIQKLVEKIYLNITPNRAVMLGYSMGGYLAGYFALSRPNVVDDLIVIGGRIKTEHFSDNQYPNLDVLALHGQRDKSVAEDRARKSCTALENMGATVTFRSLDESHKLNAMYVEAVKAWLKKSYN